MTHLFAPPYSGGVDRVRTTNILLLVVAVFVVGVVLKSAETVFVTLFVSFLLAYVMEVPVRVLRRLGLPLWLSVLLTALTFFGLLLGLVFLLYSSLDRLARDLPAYQAKLMDLLRNAVDRVRAYTAASLNIDLSDELGKLSISSSSGQSRASC